MMNRCDRDVSHNLFIDLSGNINSNLIKKDIKTQNISNISNTMLSKNLIKPNKCEELILSLDNQRQNTFIYLNIQSRSDSLSAISLINQSYANNISHLYRENSYKLLEIEQKDESAQEKVFIDVEINNLSDLLQLIKNNPIIDNVEYNIDMKTLHKIYPSLSDLNNMIGMNTLKENIVDQIIYYIQEFHHYQNTDFMHTVIYGAPGTGKTEIAKIIGKIFCNLGILKRGTFKKVTRSDLIAGYLGQTALKTRDVIKESLGGVLFIDEAYALGNSEKRDSFAKECIDTLCEALSDNKDNLMVIIAGYEEELKTCFFDYNKGLESRFTWRFKTDNYSYHELHNIFLKKIKDNGWSIKEGEVISDKWFEKNIDYFKYFGRDMETLFAKVKICHSRRVFCKDKSEKTKITKIDLDKGMDLYLSNEEVKSRKCKFVNSMYL